MRHDNTQFGIGGLWIVVVVGTLMWYPCQCRIMEKIETVCNGPCGRMTALCPKGHRVAIRDAVYRVQEKTVNCTAFPGCNDASQDVCCEPTPSDCVFPFSPTHLKALLRNCSGNADCLIQTERSDVESVACSTTEPGNLSSQTALNYVCVNDDVIVNICSKTESVVRGKTLFAMLSPQGMRKPPKGSVCTCLAESTRWPTINSIAVFLVDMRLNTLMSRDCAGSSLSLRSGNNVKQLDCDSSRDPRVNFPFVAVLNDSNVATLRLEINQNLPEFLWFGFEANEEEDIRLSCKLQGFLSNDPNSTSAPSNGNSQNEGVTQPATDSDGVILPNDPSAGNKRDSQAKGSDGKRKRSKGANLNVAALVGGMIAGFLIILLVAGLVTFLYIRWRHKQQSTASCDLTDPDMEVYYSTTDEEIQNLASSKSGGALNQDTYTCPDMDVKIRKKTSSKKVRIISTPEFLEANGEDYVSALEVRERKRLSEKKELESGDNYDHLVGAEDQPNDSVLDGYDQLTQNEDKPPSYSSVSGHRGGHDPFRGLDSCYDLDLGRVNQAYEYTSVPGAADAHSVEQPGLYFELEKRVSDGDSLSYEEHYFVKDTAHAPAQNHPKHSEDREKGMTSSGLKWPVTSAQLSMTYTDAISTNSAAATDVQETTVKTFVDKDKNRRTSMPVAAPRRNIPKESRCSQYDIAKPIQ